MRMTTSEYLNHLETKEKQSRLLSWLETDANKKRQEQRKAQKIRKLIQRVRIAATGGIQTADARSLFDEETPEENQKIKE